MYNNNNQVAKVTFALNFYMFFALYVICCSVVHIF